MGKKRKPEATRLDEVDRSMYTTFRSAANSLSQLYTHAMNQQKLAFQAGERHGMEKLYQWILRQHEEGSRVMGADIVAHLQHELEYSGEDASMSPRLQFQHHPQHSQITQFPNSNTNPNSLVQSLQTTLGPGPRPGHSDQSRDLVFSNALSSPVRRGLQPFHLAESGYFSSILPPSNGASGNNETSSHQNRESNSHSSNDSSMDMHTESPTRGSY